MMRMRVALAALLCAAVTSALGLAVLDRPAPAVSLPQAVTDALAHSGVAHPVTAVLLNFRSYDTLLEVAVLLLAAVVALALHEAQPDKAARMGLDNPLLRAAMSWLVPLMLLAAGYLLWAGSVRPGGAFQAGAVLAATGVSLRLAGVSLAFFDPPRLWHAGLSLGLTVFLLVGIGPLLSAGTLLAYPAGWAGALILVIEFALALSIGLTLLSLYRLSPPRPDAPPGEHEARGGRRADDERQARPDGAPERRR